MAVPSYFSLIGLSFLVILGGCCGSDQISIRNEYLTYDYLASVQVDTPDPRRCGAFCGQQLIIKWWLDSCYWSQGDLSIVVDVRMRNQKLRQLVIPLPHRRGYTTYRVINDDYFQTGGILTYKAELRSGDEVLKTWTHQIWTRLIDLSDDDEEWEDDEE